MSYKVVISKSAQQNIEDAISYYNEYVSKKVADRFVREFGKVITQLTINPFYRRHDKNYRVLPFNKFPFLTFFSINEKTKQVSIKAIFHTSQNPRKYPKE